jgi:two-component system response regulator AtoC
LPLNCGALPETLLEAELFGHEKGAFTGAVGAKAGLIEAASSGTIFFDEVGELPAATQVRLLRVLENREVLRVGGRRPTPVDIRVISATNQDLSALVRAGSFRPDLYYRLNGITLSLPPLRERTDEILPLARTFAEEAARALGRGTPVLSDAVCESLIRYPWPGSIRELKNTMDRAVALSPTSNIEPEHLMLAEPQSTAKGTRPLQGDLDRLERERIVQALARVGGNQTKAAALLGVSRRTLLRRLDEYDLSRPRKPEGED